MNIEVEKQLLKKIQDEKLYDNFTEDDFITAEGKQYFKLIQKYKGDEGLIMWALIDWPINEYWLDVIALLPIKSEIKDLLQDIKEEKRKLEMIEFQKKISLEPDINKVKEMIEKLPEFPEEKPQETIDEVVEDVVAWILWEWEPIKKLASWYSQLDKKLDWGFYPWTLNIIAWWPGTWKSALALSIFCNQVITHDYSWVYFSLEMWRKELLQRIFSNQTWILFSKIRGWVWEGWNFSAINTTLERLKESKFELIDNMFNFNNICGKIRELSKKGLDIAFIDYLGLMWWVKADSKYLEISIMTRRLKELSRECNIPLIVLSQLNRNSSQRWDKTPQLWDLRDSWSIEQDADSVLMLYKPDEESTELDMRIRKNRNWPSDVCLEFITEYEYMRLKERYGTS